MKLIGPIATYLYNWANCHLFIYTFPLILPLFVTSFCLIPVFPLGPGDEANMVSLEFTFTINYRFLTSCSMLFGLILHYLKWVSGLGPLCTPNDLMDGGSCASLNGLNSYINTRVYGNGNGNGIKFFTEYW